MTYLEKLFGTLAIDPHRIALVDADHGNDWTAAEFIALTARLAEALRRSTGMTKGSVVAIVAPATVEGLAVRYATGLLGGVTVYCPDANTPQRLTVFLQRIDADLLVVFPETAEFGPTTVPTVSVGHVAGVATDLLTVEVGTPTLTHTPVESTDVCALVATGGTTGVSKASRRDWAGYTTMADLGATPGRRQLIVTPLAYIAQIIADGVLIGGGTVLLHRQFEANQVLRSLGRHRITHMTLVEPHLVELVDSAALDSADLSTVVAINHIGADAAASLRARLLARLGRAILVNPYGASEIGMVSALAAPDYSLAHPELLSASGVPLPGVQVRIADGVVQVRSSAQAQGYSVAPPVSGFGDDGWFATGDLGELDAQGYLHIRGRSEDLREVCDRPVVPLDLQEAFCALPGVRYAVAVPTDDGFGLALVVDPAVVVDDLVDIVRTTAGAHLVPVKTVVLERIPRTEQGKPDRAALTRLLFGG
ncbi:MAG: class I adenylate-forming enzyme family protein [Mycobacterium sp.]